MTRARLRADSVARRSRGAWRHVCRAASRRRADLSPCRPVAALGGDTSAGRAAAGSPRKQCSHCSAGAAAAGSRLTVRRGGAGGRQLRACQRGDCDVPARSALRVGLRLPPQLQLTRRPCRGGPGRAAGHGYAAEENEGPCEARWDVR